MSGDSGVIVGLLPATVASSTFPLAFKHESFKLCEENGYGQLRAHRTHQRRQRQISVRQRAVLEESSPGSDEGTTYYFRPTSGDKRTPIKIGKMFR